MERQEFVTWFNNGLPPESYYLKIDTAALLKFEKSNFNRNSDNLPLVTNGEYHEWPEYREAVLSFVTGEKKLLLSNTITYKFCYQTNRAVVNEKIIKNIYRAALTYKGVVEKTSTSSVILEEEQIDDKTRRYICRTSRIATYFTFHGLFSDFLNLRLSPPTSYDEWEQEKKRIIGFIEKYGLKIIPYDFTKPLSERPNFFYCVKEYYSLFNKYYKRQTGRQKTRESPKSILPINISSELKSLFRLLPQDPVKSIRKEIIESLSPIKVQNFFGYSRKNRAVIPVSNVADSLISLLYLHLWKEEITDYDFIRCRNCKNFFWRDIPHRIYCCINCANTARQKRYRRKLS